MFCRCNWRLLCDFELRVSLHGNKADECRFGLSNLRASKNIPDKRSLSLRGAVRFGVGAWSERGTLRLTAQLRAAGEPPPTAGSRHLPGPPPGRTAPLHGLCSRTAAPQRQRRSRPRPNQPRARRQRRSRPGLVVRRSGAALRRTSGGRGGQRGAVAMPMKGRFPVRRTLQYLSQGDVVFKSSVKVMTVNYNTAGEPSEGARKFVFFNIPQIQYKNPWVQIMLFRNMTPSPFLRFYLDSGEQVLVDVEDKTNKEITEHIKKILGKSKETLEKEERERGKLSHPATFGPKKYHLRECMCEIEGQVPCPAFVPLPKEMRGKYKASLKNPTSA